MKEKLETLESLMIWNKLTKNEQELLVSSSNLVKFSKSEHINKDVCLGLIIVVKGTIRAFITSENGKEITLYNLLKNDICLFSASCIMKDISFDISLECKENTLVLLIPTEKYKILLNIPVISNYINSILQVRFSDMMFVFEQFVFHSLDKRLANYLLNLNEIEIIKTHEEIANDLGTAREVISRMLKYFEKESIIKLSRNKIAIINKDNLEKKAL